MCVYICTSVCVHVCMQVCVCAYIYVCVWVCVCEREVFVSANKSDSLCAYQNKILDTQQDLYALVFPMMQRKLLLFCVKFCGSWLCLYIVRIV